MAEPGKTKRPMSALVRRDGALCLTFVNTDAGGRQPIGDYAGLVAWGRRHGALTAAEAGHLEGLAVRRPEHASAAFSAAEELRALLAQIMNALADGERPPGEAIESLSAHLLHTVPPYRIVPTEGGFGLGWAAGREDDLGRPLWRLVQSAADVVTSRVRGRVVRCAGEGCGLLFLAFNQGWPRKWCDMKACGNRVKALRRYHDHVKPYRQEVKREAEKAVLERARERVARARQAPSGRS